MDESTRNTLCAQVTAVLNATPICAHNDGGDRACNECLADSMVQVIETWYISARLAR